VVSFVIETRFDNNVIRASKLSLKERLSLINSAFQRPRQPVTAEQFYANVGALPKNDGNRELEETLQHPSLSCRLFPFQKRALTWMLQRERHAPNLRATATSSQTNHLPQNDLPPLWERVTDLNDRNVYINRHLGFLTLDKEWVCNSFTPRPILGGILAEALSAFKIILIVGNGTWENY
jgi:E3 ubiquitin-protein ligase SHPRH